MRSLDNVVLKNPSKSDNNNALLYYYGLTGRLFHRVAAAFSKHLLPYVTPRVFGTVSSGSDSDVRDLVERSLKIGSSKYQGADSRSTLCA